MKWRCKILGAIAGYLIGGWVGMIIGFIVGHVIDSVYPPYTNTRETFIKATFLVMGRIAKADGRVSEEEIELARSIMDSMHLSDDLRSKAIELFNRGKHADFDINTALKELDHACGHKPGLIFMFVEIQIHAALADGTLSPEEQQIIEQICQHFNIPSPQFENTQTMFSQTDNITTKQAYDILNINPEASNENIKRAYRRMMSQYHPDKLVSQGLPEQMMQLATKKTQQIKEAYEQIKAVRGL